MTTTQKTETTETPEERFLRRLAEAEADIEAHRIVRSAPRRRRAGCGMCNGREALADAAGCGCFVG